MSGSREMEEPGSRLLLAAVLVAVCVVFAGLASVRSEVRGDRSGAAAADLPAASPSGSR
jgi:ABC-type Fe3+ transport system permease subunit